MYVATEFVLSISPIQETANTDGNYFLADLACSTSNKVPGARPKVLFSEASTSSRAQAMPFFCIGYRKYSICTQIIDTWLSLKAISWVLFFHPPVHAGWAHSSFFFSMSGPCFHRSPKGRREGGNCCSLAFSFWGLLCTEEEEEKEGGKEART